MERCVKYRMVPDRSTLESRLVQNRNQCSLSAICGHSPLNALGMAKQVVGVEARLDGFEA